MKIYNPKIKDTFVMQFGFPYPYKTFKEKKEVKTLNIDDIIRKQSNIQR